MKRGAQTVVLTIAVGLGALATTGARACQWNGSTDFADPPNTAPGFTNVFAVGEGDQCVVDSSKGPLFQAQQQLPIAYELPVDPPIDYPVNIPIPYTGFAFMAFGATIHVTGSDPLTIQSYGEQGNPTPYSGQGATTYPYGVFSVGAGASVTFDNPVTVITGVDPNTGKQVQTDGAIGLFASAGGTITANGTMQVTTDGTGASGVVANSTGFVGFVAGASSVQLQGGSVTTLGADSPGLYAVGATTTSGASTVVDQAAISTAGAFTIKTYNSGSPGVQADSLSMITLGGTTGPFAATSITTSGAGSIGLYASDSTGSGTAGQIVVNGLLTLTTTDATTAAVELSGDKAQVSATGGGTISSGAAAIEFLSGSGQTATFKNFIGSSSVAGITGVGDLIVADGSGATLNFTNDTAAASGANNLLDVKDASTFTFNADSSILTGAIATDGTSTSTVKLTGETTWNVTGSSTVSNLWVTSSSVVFAGPTEGGGFKTITVGNYTGAGASVTMNVALLGAGNPSGQLGDQIKITGTASGSTNVVIINTTPVSIAQAVNLNRLIPLFVTSGGGAIAPGASFVLATAPTAVGYKFSLVETTSNGTITGVDLQATPTTSQGQVNNSVNNVAGSQQKALITSQVLTSILLGATEQVNCSNCGSGFGGIGSYALGAHGRTSLTPELTLMGGFSYDEYSAPGITVTNAPTFAGSLVYDPTNFGQSRPFVEVGGGVIPFEQVHYSRIYPYAGEIALGYGDAIDRSLGLFGRVGWVDRVTPNDEAAAYADISRSWLQAGGYSEAPIGSNPIPATVSTGLQALDVARVGAQWTHLFANQFEVNVGAALAYGFNAVNDSQWAFTGYSPVTPYPISNSAWCEWGARVGYRLGNRMVVDAFAIGTLGGQIGATIHGGVGMRYLF